MTEETINEYLRQSLGLYFKYKKQGKEEIANLVLAMASKLANIDLDLYKIRDGYHRVHCPTCKKQLTDGKEIEFARQVGECPSCDHVQTDLDCERDLEFAREEVGK